MEWPALGREMSAAVHSWGDVSTRPQCTAGCKLGMKGSAGGTTRQRGSGSSGPLQSRGGRPLASTLLHPGQIWTQKTGKCLKPHFKYSPSQLVSGDMELKFWGSGILGHLLEKPATRDRKELLIKGWSLAFLDSSSLDLAGFCIPETAWVVPLFHPA